MANQTNRKNSFVKTIKERFGRAKVNNRKSIYRDNLNYGYQTFYNAPGKPVWSGRNYVKFSDEGFIKNVITHRAINLIASGAASVPWVVQDDMNSAKNDSRRKKLQELLGYPNPSIAGAEFFEALYSYKLINGNAYIQAVKSSDGMAHELFTLRPDRVSIIAGKSGLPAGYRYSVNEKYTDFKVDPFSGQSDILHLKSFHPLDDWYGLSNIEAAAYSIDQHNQAGEWNRALLQNGARPSGALIVKGLGNDAGYLSEEQYMPRIMASPLRMQVLKKKRSGTVRVLYQPKAIQKTIYQKKAMWLLLIVFLDRKNPQAIWEFIMAMFGIHNMVKAKEYGQVRHAA